MPDCLFCKMAWKEISSPAVLYENEHVLAFLDIHPRAPGHALVIPKYHATGLTDLPDAQSQELFSAVKKVASGILDGLKADGITIGINHGKAAGQEVPHLHVHLIPRWEDDGGNSLQSVVMNQPKESLAQIAKKIVIND